MGFSRLVIFCVLVVLSTNGVLGQINPSLMIYSSNETVVTIQNQRFWVDFGGMTGPWNLHGEEEDNGIEVTQEKSGRFIVKATRLGKWTLIAEKEAQLPGCYGCDVVISRTIFVVDKLSSTTNLPWSESSIFYHNAVETFDGRFQADVIQKIFRRTVTTGTHAFIFKRQEGCAWNILTDKYTVQGINYGKMDWKSTWTMGWSGFHPKATTPTVPLYVAIMNPGKMELVVECQFSDYRRPAGSGYFTKKIVYLIEIDSVPRLYIDKRTAFHNTYVRGVPFGSGEQMQFRRTVGVGGVRVFLDSERNNSGTLSVVTTPYKLKVSNNPTAEPIDIETSEIFKRRKVVSNVSDVGAALGAVDYVDIYIEHPGQYKLILKADYPTSISSADGSQNISAAYYIFHLTAV